MDKNDINYEQIPEIRPEEESDHATKLQSFLVLNCMRLTTFVYLIIAILLVFAIILAIVEAVQALFEVGLNDVIDPIHNILQLNDAVNAILFIIVLATLIDLVRSYIKYNRVLVRPILVAGITTMVRRLLVWDNMGFAELLGIGIIIIILAVSIVFLGREDRRVAKCSKGKEYQEVALPSFQRKKTKGEEKNSESED